MPAYDWRTPTDADRRRQRTLLREVRIQPEGDVERLEQAGAGHRAIGGDQWSIGIGRYADRAEMCRVLASWVEDEYRPLQEGGSYQRQGDLDDRRHVAWHTGTLMLDPSELASQE